MCMSDVGTSLCMSDVGTSMCMSHVGTSMCMSHVGTSMCMSHVGTSHKYVSMCQHVLTHADCCYNRTQSVLELLVDNTHVGTSSTSWALLDDNRKYYF